MIDCIVKSWYNIIMGYIVFAISTISPLGAHVNACAPLFFILLFFTFLREVMGTVPVFNDETQKNRKQHALRG